MRNATQKFLRKTGDKEIAEQAPSAETKGARHDDLGLFPKESTELKEARMEASGPSFLYEYLLKGGDLTKVIEDRKLQYPNHIPHWDRSSPQYIPSECDDEAMTARVGEHNRIMEDFRKDLLLQGHLTEIWESEMARVPRGVPGVHRNLYEPVADYDVKSGYEQTSMSEAENAMLQSLSNEKLINRSLFIPREPQLSNVREWERELEERPVNAHFHTAKGSKFDVEVPYGEKFPHVADRLGHPEIFPRPIDSVLRIENVNCHPHFLDLPFAQTPPAEPDASLDFAPGEVVFYKPDNLEWGKFWTFNYAALAVFGGLAHPFYTVIKTSSTFGYVQEELPVPVYAQSINNIDYFMVLPPIAAAVVLVVGGVGARLIHAITRRYVSKIQFNHAKDLVFVTSHDVWGKKTEKAYEMAHLEILPPATKTAAQFIDNSEKGMTTIKCLNSDDAFILHNEQKYWNGNVRAEFLSSVRRLWDKSYYEYNPY